MRVELYKHDYTYTLLVDNALVLSTTSKSIADYWYKRACDHSSTSSEPYRIPLSEPYTTTSKPKS